MNVPQVQVASVTHLSHLTLIFFHLVSQITETFSPAPESLLIT